MRDPVSHPGGLFVRIPLHYDLHPLLLAAVCPGLNTDQGVQGHPQIGDLFSWEVQEIGVQTPQYGLMRHDEQCVALLLDLEDDWLQATYHIHVAFSARKPVIELVENAGLVLLGELLLDLLIGETVAYSHLLVEEDREVSIVWWVQ